MKSIMKPILKVRYWIAIGAILIIALRIKYPEIKYDNISFYLTLLIALVLLIPDIGDLVSRMKKFKKGDLEIELESKINDLAVKTEKVEKDIEASTKVYEFERFPEDLRNRIAEYTRDPRGGLIAVAVEIESKIDEIARYYEIEKQAKYKSPIKIIDELTKLGISPQGLPKLVSSFWEARNQAVHSTEIKWTNEKLYSLLDIGIRILDLLSSLKTPKD